jgi:hypothetical protein
MNMVFLLRRLFCARAGQLDSAESETTAHGAGLARTPITHFSQAGAAMTSPSAAENLTLAKPKNPAPWARINERPFFVYSGRSRTGTRGGAPSGNKSVGFGVWAKLGTAATITTR